MYFGSLLFMKCFVNVLMWVGFEILLVLKVPFPKNMQQNSEHQIHIASNLNTFLIEELIIIVNEGFSHKLS
jgi:hypothetical protein